MNHSMLKVVNSESHEWTVRVRVVRFVQSRNSEDPSKPGRLDFILLDEEGTAMEAHILEKWINKFSTKLKEDSVYYIRYFQVMNARMKYRTVDHDYMARFTTHTELYGINLMPETFPRYACAIVPYEELHARLGITDYCSDTIGIFNGCSQIISQGTRKGTKSMRNVYITDGRQEICVTLWGDVAEHFDADKFIDMGKNEPVVLLLVAVTSAKYDNKLVLQGSLLCRCYANPDLPEVTALRNSYIGIIAPPVWHGPTVKATNPEKISIADLSKFSNPHIIYNNKYVICAKIKCIVPNKSWWYLACELCNKGLKKEGGILKCIRRDCLGKSGNPRYLLSVTAMDPKAPSSGKDVPTVELTFFGPRAEEIIGVPVRELIDSNSGIAAFLPKQITALYGRQFELKVSVSPFSLQQENITYQVDSVVGAVHDTLTERTTIIPELHAVVQEGDHPTDEPNPEDIVFTTAKNIASGSINDFPTYTSGTSSSVTVSEMPQTQVTYTPPPEIVSSKTSDKKTSIQITHEEPHEGEQSEFAQLEAKRYVRRRLDAND